MSKENLDFKFEFNAGNNFKRLPQAIDYLKSLDLKCLIDDNNAFHALFLWSKTQGYYLDDMKKYLEQHYSVMSSLLGDILLELTTHLAELNFDDIYIELDNQYKELPRNHRMFSLITYVLYAVNLSLSESFYFNINFASHNGLKSLLAFLRNDSLGAKIINAYIQDFSFTKLNLVNYVVLDLHSMSRFYEEHAQLWNDLDTLNILLRVGKARKETQFDAYISISNIATDKQLETLSEVHNIIASLTDIVKSAANMLQNENVERVARQVLDDEKKPRDTEMMSIKRDDGLKTTIMTPLRALYNLAVNDKLRSDIYFNYNTKEYLKVIIQKGNEFEEKLALKLLCQLTFEKKISSDIQTDVELMNSLKREDRTSELIKLRKTILWNIETSSETPPDEPISGTKHIMISYNSASRALCLKVKSYLESKGHKVWIDVSNIHGASLDSMAKAVEDAYCVLICVTEKYRQSLNCQAEAQYSFKLNKHIIPLIMEKGYESCKGWLGIIMSDKIFINFTKYDYEECTRRLKSEIDNYIRDSQIMTSNSTTTAKTAPTNNQSSGGRSDTDTGAEENKVETWNEENVKKWFADNNIDSRIAQEFLPCKGSVLRQLHDMRIDAPEFYFQALTRSGNSNKAVELKTILIFTDLLKKLFA